jgi:xanthine dehydrogenase YagS FAD-binding subunit
MPGFGYYAPVTLDQALSFLDQDSGAQVLAGGTDLLAAIRRGTAAPETLVNLKTVPELAQIRRQADGWLAIGALTSLSAVASHPLVLQHGSPLSQAAGKVGTPQIRNVGTLGGNLCQRPRCWYFRHSGFPCLRTGGQGCFAVGGRSRYHAIFGGHGCSIVHPSDTAGALVAMDARVRIAGRGGRRDMLLSEFLVGPRERRSHQNVLGLGEILTEILVPPWPPGAEGVFLKATERRATDFALASVAVVLARKGDELTHVRIVLGGVAPVPWRVQQAENVLRKGGTRAASIDEACEVALAGARPLSENAYKVALVAGLLSKALAAVAATGSRH